MIFRKYQTYKVDKRFVIEEDMPEVGWHLYVYDKNNNCVAEYLQDNFDLMLRIAFEEFHIQKENWELINDL